ncbi:Protease 2 [Hordeum vulgare]|nr:Protease 2 [Hordeum vulgare]
MTERTSVPSVEQRIMIDASNAYSQPESEDGDVDCDFDEVEEGFHGIDIGDLDAYIAQKEMDRELPFRRLYGYDSDDEGPQEELDEDGFMKEENQIHFELTVLEKRTHFFRYLSLAHKVVVDGGMRNTAIEPTPCPDPGEPRDENEDENAYLKKGLKFPSLPAMKMKDAFGRHVFIRFDDESAVHRPMGHAKEVDGGRVGQGEGEGCAHTIMLVR